MRVILEDGLCFNHKLPNTMIEGPLISYKSFFSNLKGFKVTEYT